jgi:hypothetical protein
VCTVVIRWSEGQPVRILALRDELTSRSFDDPGRWWPDLPDVVGGRDRAAGGTWCATDVETGATALVLNRPQRPEAAPGAPSRGVLPLLGAAHGADWRRHVRVEGMAAFLLVLATPERLVTWDVDRGEVREVEHPPGTARPSGTWPRSGRPSTPRAGVVSCRPHRRRTTPARWSCATSATVRCSPPSSAS